MHRGSHRHWRAACASRHCRVLAVRRHPSGRLGLRNDRDLPNRREQERAGMKPFVLVLLASLSLIAATDNVSVDVQRVLADVSSKPLGINTDFFVDDDANRTAQRTLDQALTEMSVK